MTGTQIKQVLEDAINFYLDPSGSWGAYPRASGLRFDVNEGKMFGERVSNLQVKPQLKGTWSDIDMDTTYTVVTNNFIATPRDGYYEFGNIDEELKVDSYVEYAQSFIEYAQSVGTLEPVKASHASTQEWSDVLTFTVCSEYGCLTASSFSDKVKSKDLKDGYATQQWSLVDGKFMSVSTGKCLMKGAKKFIEVGDCASAPTVMHSSFDGNLYLGDDLTMVVGAVSADIEKVKLQAKGSAFDFGQIWTIDVLN